MVYLENFAVNYTDPNYPENFAANYFEMVHGKVDDVVDRGSSRQGSRFSLLKLQPNAILTGLPS